MTQGVYMLIRFEGIRESSSMLEVGKIILLSQSIAMWHFC